MPGKRAERNTESPTLREYVKPLPLADVNIKFLNNPRLSKNVRRTVISEYRYEHPEKVKEDRKIITELKRLGMDTNKNRKRLGVLSMRTIGSNPGRSFPRQKPRGSVKFARALAKRKKNRRK